MSDKYVYLYQTEELYNQMTTDYGDGTRSL